MNTRLPKPSLFFQAGRSKPWGVRIRVKGKYVPSYFATEKERDQKAAEMTKEIAAEERPITPEQRSWIRVVQSAARASGVSEVNISAWLFAALSDRGKADATRASAGVEPVSPSLVEARKAWLAQMERRNLRPRTLINYVRFTGFFVEEIGLQNVGDLERREIIQWITNRYTSETSRSTVRNHIVPFLNWCAEQGWLSRDIFARLKWQKIHSDEKAVEWATPEMVSRLLAAADDDIRPALALGAFAGIRPDECQRIRWEDIRFASRQIAIPGTVAKKRKARLLYELSDVLWLWLDRVPKEKRNGKVFAKSARCWRRQFAGAAKEAGIIPWPQDALRKGFATHGAVLKGQDWAKNIMGHVDVRLLDAVYRGAVDGATAQRYFELTPGVVLEKTE